MNAFGWGIAPPFTLAPPLDPGAGIRESILAALQANAGLRRIFGTRIFCRFIPEDAALPALVLNLVSDTPDRNLSGPDGTRDARILIKAVSKDPSDSVSAMEYVRQSLEGLINVTLTFPVGRSVKALWVMLEDEGDEVEDAADGTAEPIQPTTAPYKIRYRDPIPRS